MGLLEAHAGLAGKVAVVVGGAGGFMGRGITLALAQAGVHIAACDNDDEAVRTIVPDVEALGSRILSVRADVTDADTLDAFYDRVDKEFDRVDIVVNVAGGGKRSLFVESTREDNAPDIRLNYGYIIDSVRHAVPLIRRGARGGSIINFTTIEAHRGAATFAVYAGAKAATTNFTRALGGARRGTHPAQYRCTGHHAIERQCGRHAGGATRPHDGAAGGGARRG